MSDWKENANSRRDVRHTKGSDEHRKGSSFKKKDTKQWCKGKVGREHKPICMTYAEAKLPPQDRKPGAWGKSIMRWRYLICEVCGKELDIYYGFKSEKKPDWVTK